MDDKRTNSDDDIEELEIIEEYSDNANTKSNESTTPSQFDIKNRNIKKERMGGKLPSQNDNITPNRIRNFAPSINKIIQNRNDSNMLQKRLQRGQGQNLPKLNANNINREEDLENKSTKDEVQKQVATKALSTAAQAYGVPKPLADVAASEIADPLLDAMKKKKSK